MYAQTVSRRAFLCAAGLGLSPFLMGASSSKKEGKSAKKKDVAPSDQSSDTDNLPFGSAEQIVSLSEIQRNSVSMLNYLVVLMQQINASRNSRLTVQEIYSNLLNNISPDAVDANTLDWIEDILDTLEKYRLISVKRERLESIYERAQANAALQAIPNPLGLLSAVQSGSLAKLAVSVVYMAVDSTTSYASAMSAAESEYMQENWELDDEESENLHEARKETFSKTVQTVSDYSLPGSLSLTEEAVEQFVAWQDAKVSNRLRFFEKNSDVYCALGEYWLLLARSYQKHGDLAKCIQAIETYESLATGILRKDHSYAKTLSVALSGLEKNDAAAFVEHGEKWISALLANCPDDDWALRYFAAQAYVALARESDDAKFLTVAYQTALDNVNELIPEQQTLNSSYLKPIQKLDDASGMPWASDEQKERNDYNKMLEKERETALVPIHNPLILNLDLLRALQIEHSDVVSGTTLKELMKGYEPLFLLSGLDSYYSDPSEESVVDTSGVIFDCSEIQLPAALVTAKAKISVKIVTPKGNTTIRDWKLDKVERESDDDISTFTAIFKSERAKEVSYSDASKVNIEIKPMGKTGLPAFKISYKPVSTKTKPWENLAVWDDGYSFERL